MIKRIFDILLSLIGVFFLFPIMLATSILSFVLEGRPIFFCQKRLGKDSSTFTMVKFRTMLYGPSISAKHDISRLTKWGRFLRRTSIDELPVLYNVIKGEMSLVGPRPLPVKYLKRYNTFQIKRMKVKPGITGLAQILGRNKLSWEEKFKHDVYYTENNSMLMDINIVIKTFFLVFNRKNIEAESQEIMPEFMGSKKK